MCNKGVHLVRCARQMWPLIDGGSYRIAATATGLAELIFVPWRDVATDKERHCYPEISLFDATSYPLKDVNWSGFGRFWMQLSRFIILKSRMTDILTKVNFPLSVRTFNFLWQLRYSLLWVWTGGCRLHDTTPRSRRPSVNYFCLHTQLDAPTAWHLMTSLKYRIE